MGHCKSSTQDADHREDSNRYWFHYEHSAVPLPVGWRIDNWREKGNFERFVSPIDPNSIAQGSNQYDQVTRLQSLLLGNQKPGNQVTHSYWSRMYRMTHSNHYNCLERNRTTPYADVLWARPRQKKIFGASSKRVCVGRKLGSSGCSLNKWWEEREEREGLSPQRRGRQKKESLGWRLGWKSTERDMWFNNLNCHVSISTVINFVYTGVFTYSTVI